VPFVKNDKFVVGNRCLLDGEVAFM